MEDRRKLIFALTIIFIINIVIILAIQDSVNRSNKRTRIALREPKIIESLHSNH